RVEADDRDVLVLRLLEQRDRRLAVERGEAECLRLLVDRRLQHLHLLVDLGLVLGTLERDAHVVLDRGLLRALLHGLPELVLEALRDHRDERLGRGRAAATTGRRLPAARCGDEDERTGQRDERVHGSSSHGLLHSCSRHLSRSQHLAILDAIGTSPREIAGMVRALTGFRQASRISVSMPWYRHAPWRRHARSLAPQDGPSTCCSCSSIGASTASPRASCPSGWVLPGRAWPTS